MATQYQVFTPAPTNATLPTGVQDCINTPSASCDTQVIGSTIIGTGMCSSAAWAQTGYCACVNNTLPCATLTSPYCTNNPIAYKPFTPSPACTEAQLCVNALDTGTGSGNVLGNIVQSCSNVQPSTTNYPLMILIFIIIAIIISLIINWLFPRAISKNKELIASSTK